MAVSDFPIMERKPKEISDTEIATLKTLKSIDNMLLNLNARQVGTTPMSQVQIQQNRAISGFEKGDLSQLKKEAYKSLIGPLRLLTDPMEKFFGIDLQKATGGLLKKSMSSLTTLITGVNEEERKTIKLKKEMEKAKYKELLRESKENERLLKQANINSKVVRNEKGQIVSTKGWSNLEKQREILSVNADKVRSTELFRTDTLENRATSGIDKKISRLLGVDYRASESNFRDQSYLLGKQKSKLLSTVDPSLIKLAGKNPELLGMGDGGLLASGKNKDVEKDTLTKERKKFKVTTSPTVAELSRNEAGQAILWYANSLKKGAGGKGGGEDKGFLGNMLGSALGPGLGGVLGKAGGMLMKAGPIAAIAGSLLWMGFDAVQGYLKSEKWGTSKVSSVIGGMFGGSGKGMGNALKNAAKGALVGGTIGMAFGPIGIIVGALLGAAIEGILGYIGGENIAKWIDSIGKPMTVDTAKSRRESDIANLDKERADLIKSGAWDDTDQKNYLKSIEEIKAKHELAIKQGAYVEKKGGKRTGKKSSQATGGLVTSRGFVEMGENEPELVIPKSRMASVINGFDNSEVNAMFQDMNKDKKTTSKNNVDYGKEIVMAIEKLSEIVNNKPFNNVIQTIDSNFDADKLRTAHIYGV